MTELSASNGARLTALLNQAKGGERILLPPGRFTGFNPWKQKFDTPVTIAALDPADPPVIVNGRISDVAGLILDGLCFTVPDTTTVDYEQALYINKSSRVTFRNVAVRGRKATLTSRVTGKPTEYHLGWGLRIDDCEEVLIEDCDFSDLTYAVMLTRCGDANVVGNDFHDLASDAVQMAQVDSVVVAKNRYWNPRAVDHYHPDFAQVFTQGVEGSGGIVIEDNLVIGPGGSPQGIFISSENGKRITDVLVRRNVLIGTMWHGIAFNKVDGGEIVDNVVLPLPDPDGVVKTSWIDVANSTSVAVSGNRAGRYNGVPHGDNIVVATGTAGQAAALIAQWDAEFRTAPPEPEPDDRDALVARIAALESSLDDQAKTISDLAHKIEAARGALS